MLSVDLFLVHSELESNAYLVPVALRTGGCEFLPLALGLGVLRDDDVALELVDSLGRRGRSLGLAVEEGIPNTGSRVLRVAGAVGVDKELLAGGVSSEERDETMGPNGLVSEQLDEVVGRLGDTGEQLGVLDARVLPADVGLDTGAERADDSGDSRTHLDQVRHADVLEAELGVVLGVPGLHLVANVLQPIVLGQGELDRVEADGAVSAALLPAGRRLLVPAAGVVEAEADGLARPLGAPARAALEELGHVVGDVLPDAARILAALGALECWYSARVSHGALASSTAEDNVLDVLGDW